MYPIKHIQPEKRTLSITERSDDYIIAIVDKGYYLKYLTTIINRVFPLNKQLSHIKRIHRLDPESPSPHNASSNLTGNTSNNPAALSVSFSSSTSEAVFRIVLFSSSYLLQQGYEYRKDNHTLYSLNINQGNDKGGCYPSPSDATISSTDIDTLLSSLDVRTLSTRSFEQIMNLCSPCIQRYDKIRILSQPSADKDTFLQECKLFTWPMCWVQPLGTVPPVVSSSSSIMSNTTDPSTSDSTYFIEAMKLAIDQAKVGYSQGYQPQGCVITLPVNPGTVNSTSIVSSVSFKVRGKGYGQTVFDREWGDETKNTVIISSSTRSIHPLRTAAMNAIDYVAKMDKALMDNAKNEEKNMGIKRIRYDSLSDRWCNASKPTDTPSSVTITENEEEGEETMTYLCTGMDAFLTHEPNMMDCMALTHSRVQRVIYSIPYSSNTHSRREENIMKDQPRNNTIDPFPIQLQAVKAINHHFKVYQIIGMVEEELTKVLR